VTPLADPLDNIVVVLDEPQKLVNIAGVVRAMNNMGLTRLRLVRPAEFDATRISGIAHRSEPLVEATERFDTLEEAVADATFVLGASARARTAHRNYGWAREWGPKVVARAAEGGPVALLFGREDRGLSNQGLDLCNGIAIIPTDEEYSSLNLAQAFLILAYEIFIARQDDSAPLPERSPRDPTRSAGGDRADVPGPAERPGPHRVLQVPPPGERHANAPDAPRARGAGPSGGGARAGRRLRDRALPGSARREVAERVCCRARCGRSIFRIEEEACAHPVSRSVFPKCQSQIREPPSRAWRSATAFFSTSGGLSRKR
jgi:TrmH family RNA methyltransferase